MPKRTKLPQLSTRYIKERMKPGDILLHSIKNYNVKHIEKLVLTTCLNSSLGRDYISVWSTEKGHHEVYRSKLSQWWHLILNE